jgi:hypothetical protein
MLDDVDGTQRIEDTIAKRIGKPVEIADNVGIGIGIQVDSDGPGIFVDSAADVENARARRPYA